jgi:hypothetical protein
MKKRWCAEILICATTTYMPFTGVPQDHVPGQAKPAITIFGTTTPLPGSLHGKVYRLPYIEKLPDYESFNSVGDLYTYTLQIKPQVYREEYPGPIKRDTWFGIDYRGTFWNRKAGSFQFFLRSDDGANCTSMKPSSSTMTVSIREAKSGRNKCV